MTKAQKLNNYAFYTNHDFYNLIVKCRVIWGRTVTWLYILKSLKHVSKDLKNLEEFELEEK